jgi:RNA polymerase sigma-70 factor (ECF subfamily)
MDIVQDVFRAVLIAIDRFRRDREGDSFQAWLRAITRNKVRDFFRAAARRPLAVGGTDMQRRFEEVAKELESEGPDDAQDERHSVLLRALELVRAEFEDRTWVACWRTTVDGDEPAAVAREMGMTVGAVYKAKSRVLARLRAELEGLMEV